MHKDDVCELPPGSMIVGLGWTCDGAVDLDASIICLDKKKKKVDLINHTKTMGSGITHRGDNPDGAGEGDDERIRIDFANVPMNCTELYVTVNIASENCTFKSVRDAFVRVGTCKKGTVFNPEHILAEYPLDGNITTRGLVFCRFIRLGNGWTMQALGWGCGGGSADEDECMFIV